MILKKALDITYRHYTWLERDAAWSWELYDLLSLSSYYSGDKKSSLAYAIKAASYNPDDSRLSNNVKEILINMTDKDFI